MSTKSTVMEEARYFNQVSRSAVRDSMDYRYNNHTEGPFSIGDPDASVPSLADLEQLSDLPDFGFDLQSQYPIPMEKIKQEVANTPGVGSAGLHAHRHFDFSQGPSTPYSATMFTSSSAQSSPLSHSEDEYSDEERKPKMGGGSIDLLALSDEELSRYSARDINKMCKGYPEEAIKQIKRRRRTLKNRGYASNSRVRRMQQKHELESTKQQLQQEVTKLRQEVDDIRRQRDYYKNRAEVLTKKAAQK